MNIIEMAKELGTMIKQSDEMANLRKSEESMMQDEKAKGMINDLCVLQDEIAKAMEDGREQSVVESIQERFMTKQKDIQAYDITREYLETKSKFDKLMQSINDVIVFTITGQEPSCSSHSCGSCGCGCE